MSEEEAKVWKNLGHTNSLCYTVESDPFDISDDTVFLPNTFNKIIKKFRELGCSHIMIVGYVPDKDDSEEECVEPTLGYNDDDLGM